MKASLVIQTRLFLEWLSRTDSSVRCFSTMFSAPPGSSDCPRQSSPCLWSCNTYLKWLCCDTDGFLPHSGRVSPRSVHGAHFLLPPVEGMFSILKKIPLNWRTSNLAGLAFPRHHTELPVGPCWVHYAFGFSPFDPLLCLPSLLSSNPFGIMEDLMVRFQFLEECITLKPHTPWLSRHRIFLLFILIYLKFF